jgi:hypothetical protein
MERFRVLDHQELNRSATGAPEPRGNGKVSAKLVGLGFDRRSLISYTERSNAPLRQPPVLGKQFP